MNFSTSKLFELSNKKYVSELLNVEKNKLKNISSEFVPYMFTSVINNKERTLYNPSDEHKIILKKIVRLLSRIDLPSYAFGGIKGKNYIGNAAVHKKNSFLLLVDIKAFFPSTSDSYIYALFNKKFNMPPDIAKIFTDLVTVPCENRKGRYLPQGYPTSPLLSLFAYIDMYEEIAEIAFQNGMEFTGYYDDLTLSSDKFISKSIKRKVANKIQNYGFEVHPTKTRLAIKNYTKVTGVILKDNELKVPKSLFKKLHDTYLELKRIDKDYENYTKEQFVNSCNKAQGLIAAIKSIDSNKKLDMYINYLTYIRKRYNVPYRRASIGVSFDTTDGRLIGRNILSVPQH